jgi:hypothetical protein
MPRDFSAIVPQGLDESNAIIFGRTPGDIIFGFFVPAFAVILLSIFGIIGTFGLIAGLVWTTGTAIILFRLAGPGTSVSEYLAAQFHAKRLAPHAPSMPEKPSTDSPTTHTMPDGGRFEALVEDFTNDPSNIKIWEEEQQSSDFTKVQNVYPQFDAIERADGVFITAVKISGTNLYLRSSEEENQLATEFINTLNSLDTPMQLFLTTDPFDVGQHVNVYEQASTNEAVQNNTILNELHRDYGESVIQDRRIQTTREREIYGIVSVTPEEVRENSLTDATSSRSNIAAARFIRNIFNLHDPTFNEEELESRKVAIDLLQDRQNTLIKRLSAISGVSAQSADYEDHLAEIRGHWRGPMNTHPVSVPASPIVPPKGMLDKDDTKSGLMA